MSQRTKKKAAKAVSSRAKSAKKAKAVPASKEKASSSKTKPAGKKRAASKAAGPPRAPAKKKVPKAAAKSVPASRKAAPKAAKKSTKKKAAPAAKKQSAVSKKAPPPKPAAKKAPVTASLPEKVTKKPARAVATAVSKRRRNAAREQRRRADAAAVAARKAAAKQAALKAAERQASEKQSGHYGRAVKHFNSRRFRMALPWFEKAVEGPDASLRHRAEVHVRICRRQVESDKVKLKTADDYYNYGIKLVNDRQLEEAEQHFRKALKIAPDGDHLHYASAVVRALSGDVEGASANLKRAIELNARNRLLARSDPDFSSIARHPLITELLHP